MSSSIENKKWAKGGGPTKPRGFGARHLQFLLMFFGIAIAYGLRTIMNVAIVAMIADHDESLAYPTYPEWANEKNVILSSFFWGYICFQIVAGQLAKTYGPKLFLSVAMFLASASAAFIPLMAEHIGSGGVIASRVIQGLCQGFLFPSVHNLLGAWAPLSERALWGGLVYCAQAAGNVIAMISTGLISESKAGWPVAFYLFGSLGIMWSIFFVLFGSNSPSKHSSISDAERKWIEHDLEVENKRGIPTPWKAILTSPAFLAILLTHCGQNWGYWTLLTEIPSYMEKVLNYKIASNSELSALPYLVMWILTIVMSPIADVLIKNKLVSVGVSRKIFNSIGLFIPAIALATLSIIGSDNKTTVVTILVIAVGFNAGQYCGFNVNHIDLSPTHAGVLMGLTNSLSGIFSLLAPLGVDAVKAVTGYEETNQSLWSIVFGIAAVEYFVVGTIFNIFGSGKIQEWDNTDYNPKEDIDIVKNNLS